MTRKALFISSLLAIMLISCDNQGERKLNIVPQPQSVETKAGSFKTDRLIISITGDLLNEAKLFVADFAALTGISPEITEEPNGNIALLLDESSGQAGDEGYVLDISRSKILIKAKTPAGIFYGLQTLLQLPITKKQETIQIPCVTISDAPVFAWRGNMLDVSRHFFTVDEVKTQLNLLAKYKLNTFHWHLSDDQGWRVEIKKYPLLTELGAWRINDEGSVWNYFKTISNNPKEKLYGGFYTQDEIKEIIRYAADRHITIVPEIDLPGHANAIIACYNWLSCENKPFTRDLTKPFEFSDPLCLGQEETYTFLEDVLSEILDLFPGEYFHIGGDECKRENWEICPKCQATMRQHNLTDASQLQSLFNLRMEKFIAKHGKKMIGWDEILEGEMIAPSTAIMSWRGEEGGYEGTKAGHKVVMVPSPYLYLNSKNDLLTLEKVYSYNPIPEGLTAEEASLIMGTQACLWAEHMNNYNDVQYQTLPRLLALSEIAWTPRQQQNFDSFCAKLPYQLAILESNGYEFYIPALGILHSDLFFADSYDYQLPVEVEGFDIRYTLDGSDPATNSALYEAPIRVNATTTIKAAPFLASGKRGDVKTAIITKTTLSPAIKVDNTEPGLNATYYRGMIATLADFGKMTKVRDYTANTVELPEEHDIDGFGLLFEGYLSAEEDAVYKFALKSDDGSELIIDGEKVIDADGVHGNTPVFGQKALAKGLHKIEVRYFENSYGESLALEWAKGSDKLTPIQSQYYFKNKK